MRIVEKDTLKTERMTGEGSAGIYEKFVQKNIEDLLSMTTGQAAVVTIDEIGSKAEKPTGCVYGLNRVFVAGQLPYKAYSHKNNIKVLRTGDLFESKHYACDANVTAKGDYEQPSHSEIERVQKWLDVHPELFVEDEEPEQSEDTDPEPENTDDVDEPEQSEEFEHIESDTFNSM